MRRVALCPDREGVSQNSMKNNSSQHLHFFSSSVVGDWSTNSKYSIRFIFWRCPLDVERLRQSRPLTGVGCTQW